MPRSTRWTWVLAALLAAPGALAGQQFNGSGQRATELFALPEGLSVFEMEHRADAGSFVVRLLDADGAVVDELARAEGRFGGSKAVRIPRGGSYLLDVSAAGAWSVRRRDAAPSADGDPANAPAFARGVEAGVAAGSAAAVSSGGWFARGVAGGLVLGPVGMGIAAGLAGRSSIEVPEPSTSGTLDLAFSDGYRQGFEDRVRARRRKSALVGGIVGTGILVGALIAALDIAGAGEGAGTTPPPPPGTGLSISGR